jgi:hypothetical protein
MKCPACVEGRRVGLVYSLFGGEKLTLKLAVVALIVALRIMQIVIGRDGATGPVLANAMDPTHEPALTALNETLEERTEKLKNPPGWAAGRDIPGAGRPQDDRSRPHPP